MAQWSFVEGFDSARRRRLERITSFDDVVQAISDSSQVQGAWLCEGEELGPIDCWRPVVRLDVEAEAFDVFFNGPAGYRAQYLASPDQGQAANALILRALEPGLTAAVAQRCGERRLSREGIRVAFLANSAKIWPDEDALDFVEATIDLAVETWKKPCDWISAPAFAGLWAPQGTKLKVFGAFIDPYGNEVVSRKKVLRRFDIHECGFS
jgi:hypothetical protein